jgi:5-deoxy-glucuronate isomerase
VSTDTIHRAAVPSSATADELRIRPAADGHLAIDPRRAGWRYLSFRVSPVLEGRDLHLGRAGHELVLVNLVGADVELVHSGDEVARIGGRASVFDGPPSAFYLPADRPAAVRVARSATVPARAVLAIAEAPSRPEVAAGLEPRPIRPGEVRLEVRGTGHATRHIRHIVPPEFPADRLLLSETVTPAGNWSSWPPHKHDVDGMPGEAVLEEVYHYRFRRAEGWGIQRLYRRPERGLPPRDATWTVHDGDVVLVTDGYHPFAANLADDAFYLNALAGDRRTMAYSYDPDFR